MAQKETKTLGEVGWHHYDVAKVHGMIGTNAS
jgi:hypothetical protein